MFRFDAVCGCGRTFSVFTEHGAVVTCPYCGKSVTVPRKEDDPERRYETRSLEEATAEILDEGGYSPSGAR
ncbi:MAG: hypothetical protein DRH56_00940 [Deltaproteobacteria bacterium]|nr:MAG: hypothetical protein DRH56_00940 [Deltaproteobacteria bacterium]